MAAAKVTIQAIIRYHQSKVNTAAIQHKKQTDRTSYTQKKHALNNAYFNCIKTSYFTHQNQSKSVYFLVYLTPKTNQIYIYSTFVHCYNPFWDKRLSEFCRATFVTIWASKNGLLLHFCRLLLQSERTFVTIWQYFCYNLGCFEGVKRTFVTIWGFTKVLSGVCSIPPFTSEIRPKNTQDQARNWSSMGECFSTGTCQNIY